MNSTQFAENLLKAIRKPFDPQNWMERLENVFYAMAYGSQKPAEITWLEMSQVEESPQILLNPIIACPQVIRIEKERLEKKAVEILYSQDLSLRFGVVADGTTPFWKWPGPEGIFKECHIFAQWIIDEMEAPSETRAPPLVEESAERIAEEMGAPSETSAPPVAGESAEGIGQVPQGCEADNDQAPDPKTCTDEQPDTVKHRDEGKPGYVSDPLDMGAYMSKTDAIKGAPMGVKMTADILDGILNAQARKLRWTRPLTREGKPHAQRKSIHREDWENEMKVLRGGGIDPTPEEIERRKKEIRQPK
jgi:hypothetical protein